MGEALENLGGDDVELSSGDLQEIEQVLSKIEFRVIVTRRTRNNGFGR